MDFRFIDQFFAIVNIILLFLLSAHKCIERHTDESNVYTVLYIHSHKMNYTNTKMIKCFSHKNEVCK